MVTRRSLTVEQFKIKGWQNTKDSDSFEDEQKFDIYIISLKRYEYSFLIFMVKYQFYPDFSQI